MKCNRKPWPSMREIAIKCRIQGQCLLWCGKTDKDGYALLYRAGRTIKMHRYVHSLFEPAFTITNRATVVRHKCNNPTCLRPAHLTHGTQLDNIADRDCAGRTQRGDAHCRAKLVTDDIRVIRALIHEGVKQVTIAKLFGVNARTISGISTGKTWNHVTKAYLCRPITKE